MGAREAAWHGPERFSFPGAKSQRSSVEARGRRKAPREYFMGAPFEMFNVLKLLRGFSQWGRGRRQESLPPRGETTSPAHRCTRADHQAALMALQGGMRGLAYCAFSPHRMRRLLRSALAPEQRHRLNSGPATSGLNGKDTFNWNEERFCARRHIFLPF